MIRIQYHRSCDRCAEPFDEKTASSSEELPTRTPLGLKFISKDHVVFEWNDLCESCESAVSNLLDRLRLTDKKKSAKLLTETGSSTGSPSF